MKLIILNGSIASGKTTVGKLLAKKLNKVQRTIFLDLDDEVTKFQPNFQWPSTEEKDRDWKQARKDLGLKTADLLEAGIDVVMGGPFFQKEELDEVLNFIRTKVDIFLYTLEAGLQIRKERLKKREIKKTDDELVKQHNFISNFAKNYGFYINNEGSVKGTVDNILKLIYINKGSYD